MKVSYYLFFIFLLAQSTAAASKLKEFDTPRE
jgi:hypothetical protein